jgi:hypothetical protein
VLVREQRSLNLDIRFGSAAATDADADGRRVEPQAITVEHDYPRQVFGIGLGEGVRYRREIIEPRRARFGNFGRVEQDGERGAPLPAAQQKGQVVEPLDPVAEPNKEVAFLPSRDVPGLRHRRMPFGALLGIDRQRMQREQSLIAHPRHVGIKRRQRLRQKGKRGVPVRLVEGGAAQPLGLSAIEVEAHRRLITRRAAQRRLAAI